MMCREDGCEAPKYRTNSTERLQGLIDYINVSRRIPA